ncbi:hypothetical protein [Shewanella sp. GutDb-MelDb]|uniref:hypothetical protein n=1 Tax=Shewanella sp. GutDb-MelDb TaxID=2058316 RepID=UPI000C7E2A36|nr:hypothetical protein [Shewanella sp. GutDb-MelDb]PKG55245.1 hypothetical protein CXF82_20670 [Shewanella sp. GutDb-MelDb]
MNLQLSDLDELLQSVRNRYSQEYLREAVIAYRAGAYRAAVTSTWISICVDVIQKIKELSVGGDAAAAKLEVKLDAIQPSDVRGMLDFENDILRIAHEELGVISLIEKTHLERVKEDRNICSHPTFSTDGSQFVPSPELARSYIVQAANYLLTNAPLKGKVVVHQMFGLITSISFPENKTKAFEVLSSERYLGRVKESAIRNLTIILFKRLFNDEDSMASGVLLQITAALIAINRINSEAFKSACRDNLIKSLAASSDATLKRLLPVLSEMPELWRYVEEATQHRLEQVIENMSVKELVLYRVSSVASAIPSVEVYFQSSIDDIKWVDSSILLSGSPSVTLLEQAIEFFVKSGSFDSAYSNGVNILLKYAGFLDDEKLTEVFEGVYRNKTYGINQILNAGGIGEFFASLYSKTQVGNVSKHTALWLAFRNEVVKKGYNYPDLDGFMEADGIIKLEAAEVA